MYQSETPPPDAAQAQELPAAPGAGSQTAGKEKTQTTWDSIVEVTQTVLLAILLFLVIRNFIQNYRVQNISMEPNFHEGQFLIINRFSYCPGLHLDVPFINIHVDKSACVWEPQRGDVVVFHYPPDPSQDFIKRVIGLPGETVEVRDGEVYINGELMSEPFGPNPGSYNAPPVTLPADQYYVMGDNRNSSSDSHVWGPVPIKNIVGRAVVRYWPPNKWSVIPHWDFPELSTKQ
jgi:signal peptidase I